MAALYWRGRLYETQDHDPALAAANYRAIIRAYQHYFYAQMARARLAALGNTQPVAAPQLDRFQPLPQPQLVDTFPADSPHLAKARLLANAGLNEYIPQEIAADPDSSSWSALAEAQIYASYGETFRAMRALKRALPQAATAPVKSIPLAYWRILFPEPWWDTIKAESAKNNLDPYLVASLIRQESEFNPSVVSYANAWGLMQLLPSVGKAMAREEGMSHFQTFQLLDPETNIRLGTRYLRQMMDASAGCRSMRWRPTTPATAAWWTGRPPGPTTAWTSLWSRFRLRRRASTLRRSCAMKKHTGRLTSLLPRKARRHRGWSLMGRESITQMGNPVCHSRSRFGLTRGAVCRQHCVSTEAIIVS